MKQSLKERPARLDRAEEEQYLARETVASLLESVSTLAEQPYLKWVLERIRTVWDLAQEKTAVFLTVSDTDRSADRLVNLFYTQALQTLCRSADRDYPDHRLAVPVRFILDDFATNTCIPDFDNITSVIRSREIYVSIIQSLSRLNALYGPEKAKTIINNCDNCLYLGGQDVETARYISVKANRTADSILNMPLGEAYLFTRGRAPQRVRKYDLRRHERYGELPEAAARPRSARERSCAPRRNDGAAGICVCRT